MPLALFLRAGSLFFLIHPGCSRKVRPDFPGRVKGSNKTKAKEGPQPSGIQPTETEQESETVGQQKTTFPPFSPWGILARPLFQGSQQDFGRLSRVHGRGFSFTDPAKPQLGP